MKKIIAVVATSLLAFNSTAADSSDVVAGLLIGGIVGSLITENKKPEVVYQVPPPIVAPAVIQPQPLYPAPHGYRHYYRQVTVWDPYCRCYQQYWVVNQ